MKSLYSSFLTRKKNIFSILLGFLFCCICFTGLAQTCTNNDPACASVLPDLKAVLTGGTNTLVTAGSGTLFTATQTTTTTSLVVNSGKYRVTSTDGCVLVSFTQVRIGTATGPTNVSIVLSNNTVLTCPGVAVDPTTGRVCVKICDPQIINGDLITIRLTFSATSGDFTATSVQISALAVLNLAVNITCPTNFICLNQSDCPAVGTCGAGVLVGKIRVFFPTPIPVGTPTPVVTAVLNAAITLNEFKLCVSADAGTSVVRTFVDYCVYSTAVIPAPLPITALSLTLKSGLFDALTCPLSLTTVICPSGFSQITDGRPCSPCAGAFTNFVGKIRVFFPTAIPAGVPTPTITSVIDASVTLGQYKLCAIADVGTNVARTFADYCIYSNVAVNIFPFTSTTLSLAIQTNSCSPLVPQVCPVVSVTLPACPILGFQVVGTVNSSGGTSGILGSCVATTNCNGSLLYLASRLRLIISPCLAIGVPAPTITSFQTVDGSGNFSLLNQDYCFVVSNESATLIGTQRCFIEYCVYSKIQGDFFFQNPPATLVFNIENLTSVPGGPLITTTCNGASGGPLPVTLLNFSYQLRDCGVLLKWSTSQETNSKEFILQNSTNTINWASIGKVNAKGNSNNQSDYTFLHSNPMFGQNYYRFAAVDIDGQTKYSSVIGMKILCDKSALDINPNPFTDQVNISFASPKMGTIIISLMDNTGRQVYRSYKIVQIGLNNIKLNSLNYLPSGHYILSVKTDETVINHKLIK